METTIHQVIKVWLEDVEKNTKEDGVIYFTRYVVVHTKNGETLRFCLFADNSESLTACKPKRGIEHRFNPSRLGVAP